MIQRIQTLYLLLVVALSIVVLVSPVGGLIDKTQGLNYILNFWGIQTVTNQGIQTISSAWILNLIGIIIPVLALFTLFKYKKRTLQIRYSVINLFLMLVYFVALIITLIINGSKLNAEWYLQIPAALHLVNIVLTILAIVAIGKDEALVKSLNRIR